MYLMSCPFVLIFTAKRMSQERLKLANAERRWNRANYRLAFAAIPECMRLTIRSAAHRG